MHKRLRLLATLYAFCLIRTGNQSVGFMQLYSSRVKLIALNQFLRRLPLKLQFLIFFQLLGCKAETWNVANEYTLSFAVVRTTRSAGCACLHSPCVPACTVLVCLLAQSLCACLHCSCVPACTVLVCLLAQSLCACLHRPCVPACTVLVCLLAQSLCACLHSPCDVTSLAV